MWVDVTGRLSAGRIQARRTRAVFEREPVALQLGDSQVGRSLRMDVAYVRQLESPWTWPEQELSNCNPGSRARVVHSGPGRDRLRSGRRSNASAVVRVPDARREAPRTGRSGRSDHQSAGQGPRCCHGRDLAKVQLACCAWHFADGLAKMAPWRRRLTIASAGQPPPFLGLTTIKTR